MAGISEYTLNRAFLGNASTIHHCHSIAGFRNNGEIMGD
jgi:hypothetical protein